MTPPCGVTPARTQLRYLPLLLALLCLLLAGSGLAQPPARTPTQPQPFTLDELAAQLGQPTVVRGPFVQKKLLRGLTQPLVSRGEFVLARDAGLLWQLQTPLAVLYRITADGIARHTPTGWQPQAANNAGAHQSRLMLALLGGDRSGLERDFELALQGTADAWQLTLTPRAALLRQIFQVIHISGGATVAAIELIEAQGDHTRIELPASRADTDLTTTERERLAR